MVASLREQMQMARINLTKRRVHAWWHANRCEACKARAAGLAGAGGGGLVQLLQQLGDTVVEADHDDTEHPALQKAH